MKKDCKYYYDMEPNEFINLIYIDAIKLKIEKAKILIRDLYISDYNKRDDERINNIGKAIKFNQKLIEESKKIINSKKDCKYYYNLEPNEFINLIYIDAIELKIEKAKILIRDLYISDYNKRDDERINNIGKAIKFNEKLIEESKK